MAADPPDPAAMEAALRDIAGENSRYPCGRWMSPRQRARIGLGWRDGTRCEHDGPCMEPDRED